ncbi:MAG TPA: FGGY-family carbohydrate kinase [Thermomicrobiales bacterium]|nr:FGGY-family carbohydrate kinase [Thermomicrobiales bacterium]
MATGTGYLLGIDIGTTALKAVVLDPQRGVIAQAQRPHTLRSPHPGWAEEDPAEWWQTTVEAIKEIVGSIPAERIAAVAITGMVPALVLLDGNGAVIRPSIQQNDARSAREVDELRDAVDTDEFFAITGGTPNQQNIAPRWGWLARHEPEAIERTATMCGSYDYIVMKLTGERSLELNWAAESGLYDITRRAWHAPYLEQAGITLAALPPVREPSEIVGGITPEAATATGLRAGTPVVAGSADHVAAALASGLTRAGDLLLKFGGAGDILYCAERPDPDPHFYFDYHDIPGLTLINGCMAASGSLVKWFAAELAEGASLAELDREATDIPPGSGGIVVLPYVLGEKTPIFDPTARGVFAGVMLHHTRAHLFRAVLESVCYGFQHHLELLAESGRPVRRVLAADGGSRSALWMQIAADVTGHDVQVIAGEAASALGAAFVAGMGVGAFESWDDIGRFIEPGPMYRPQREAVARYREGYAIYRDLYRQLRPLFPALSRLGADDERRDP